MCQDYKVTTSRVYKVIVTARTKFWLDMLRQYGELLFKEKVFQNAEMNCL